MLTPRENALKMIYDEGPEYVPMTMECMRIVGMQFTPATEQPLGPFMPSGYDPFGIWWNVDYLGEIPDNSHFMFEDVTEWEKYVKIPDVDAIDFKGAAEKELEGVDRSQQLLTYYSMCGIYERLAAFMGFENTLVALLEEPEACHDLLDVLTDYKIDVANHVIDAYAPDIYVDYSDIATERSLFMSPDTWREMIKPHQQRYIDAVKARGVIFEQHCCGRCEDVVDDWVDMGVTLWHCAQRVNDLAGIEARYRGKLTIEGGWDSQGKPGLLDATEEICRDEVDRCIDEYGHAGGFILLPIMTSEKGLSNRNMCDPRQPAVNDEWEKNRMLV